MGVRRQSNRGIRRFCNEKGRRTPKVDGRNATLSLEDKVPPQIGEQVMEDFLPLHLIFLNTSP